jgi:hypothetical protein
VGSTSDIPLALILSRMRHRVDRALHISLLQEALNRCSSRSSVPTKSVEGTGVATVYTVGAMMKVENPHWFY